MKEKLPASVDRSLDRFLRPGGNEAFRLLAAVPALWMGLFLMLIGLVPFPEKT